MRTYRVMFFKTLINSYGKVFEVCQRTIDVSSARNTDHAVKQAKRRFEQCENINDWRLHADYFQVDALSAPPDAIRATECGQALSVVHQRRIGPHNPVQRQPTGW